ncbi:MAG: hypothetical protein IPN90_09885 [Elusimicrobia bacterium]|nr:hypothetical protein [Elusimicrobiota bacterium]
MKRMGFGLVLLMIGILRAGWAAEAIQPREGRHGGKAGDTAQGSFLVTNIIGYDVEVVLAVTDLPMAGEAVALPKGTGITLSGAPAFRLKVGESKAVNYTVVFPPQFSKLSAGAISLAIRKPGDTLSSPLVNTLFAVYLQPIDKNAVLKIDLLQPNIRFAAATAEVQGPNKVEVSLILKNLGNASVQPKGRVEFRFGGQTVETLFLTGTPAIPPGGTSSVSGLTQTTTWPDGDHEAKVTFDYGDYYRQPQQFEKTYFFRVSRNLISVQPGSATPQKVTPR